MDAPVVVTVFNNQILGFQSIAETMRFGRYTDACDFAPVDHAAIAEACGLPGTSDEFLLAATVQNLKRLVRYVTRPPPTPAAA